QDHNGAGKEINVTKWNDDTNQWDKIFEGEGSHSINSTKGNPNVQADLFGDWREEIVSYAVIGEDTTREKMEIDGDWNQKVEVEMTSTVYQYALRIFETPYPTDYNFYTLAHDDIYRNSSACNSNCYNQPPHISWYMNDHIANSPYTTQPDAKITLVNNKYKADSFDESKLPEGNGEARPAATGFVDVEGHWGKPFIDKMHKAGVIAGMDETHFAPDNTVTKGQFVTLISQAVKLETTET
ncbi:MAG: S-layer homology domain-containing protein, partial [Clostridia bacterium]|nr:S-layer homology domain-containing protein [Clostridia bacterium]